jgi:hypothetical protein
MKFYQAFSHLPNGRGSDVRVLSDSVDGIVIVRGFLVKMARNVCSLKSVPARLKY